MKTSWLTDRKRELFWGKVDKQGPLPDRTDPLVTAPPTPCWIWTAALSEAGYGAFTPPEEIRRGNTAAAHRISYMEIEGGIEEGLEMDHLCRNRTCVNPEHLEAVTRQENLLRGETVSAMRSRITHCPQGHEYTADNTAISTRNQRSCRTCKRGRVAATKKAGLPLGDPRHGTTNGYYNHGCRCEDCRTAAARDRKEKRSN